MRPNYRVKFETCFTAIRLTYLELAAKFLKNETGGFSAIFVNCTAFMNKREPDFRVLHFIREGKPIVWEELLQLWYRVENYEALETIVDIAIREHMPIWAAEESFKQSWLEYKIANW